MADGQPDWIGVLMVCTLMGAGFFISKKYWPTSRKAIYIAIVIVCLLSILIRTQLRQLGI